MNLRSFPPAKGGKFFTKGSVLNWLTSEAPRPQAGASRARSGERKASKGIFVLIVSLDPAYKAGLAGTCRPEKGAKSRIS
jgi:hypothetical protein